MTRSRAVIGTPHAERYLQQLCKHWAHRFETEFGPGSGRIRLPLGETRLLAGPEALTVDLEAGDAADLSGLREVVVRHIERFAFRETLRFDWN
ncbi:2,4-dihydroxyhept-2-ene-1,7-dioic acid aldolase [Methylorubrum populi]|uniref:2,4-dihydroxyhept-2-ene-1,7-dioic acid aldolase n=1 Tax=Methylobacterium radiotolerans TaxID=31998 RepID=A0ABU7T5S7_9HYPH